MQTSSVGKVMEEHNRVQKNTGEKSTYRKEQKGNLCSPGNLYHHSIGETALPYL